MDRAVENALRRKADLQKEIDEIELFLELHKRYGENVEQSVPKSADSSERDATPERHTRERGRPEDFALLMEKILAELNRPLTRPDFVDELERRGHVIPSVDKPRYLGTILWRYRKRFRNLPKFGYWLIERPYPPADYDPDSDTEFDRALDMEADLIEELHSEEGSDDE